MYRSEVEKVRFRSYEDLCKLVEGLGYNTEPRQLYCNNGAYVSSLLHFFDDNPGVVEVIRDWILDNSWRKMTRRKNVRKIVRKVVRKNLIQNNATR